MHTGRRATVEDLYKVEGKAEIVDGEIVHLMSTRDKPGYAADEVFVALRANARARHWGRASGDNKAFVVDLPNRKSCSPDAGFYVAPPAGMTYFEGAPLFAVEVRAKETTVRPPNVP